MGTIPGSRLQIGGTSTIDVAGYFSDPDGDELSYTGASSNESVATVSMEGSTATINAIETGDAVITITASDGSASVSQGFRIDVPAGPEEATLVISRLLDANRNQISDPTGINGTIYAVLDVQSNDETWTEIGLTLNGETVTPLCRGTGGSSADVAVGPGLAAAGQVEIECRLQTNAVLGECTGMPLMPKYANGEYELSAFLTTDDDATREAVAGQQIALKNSNFVTIAHVPGNRSEVGPHTQGLTFYGGPSTADGNVNTFHACPVAYDGTEVGKMQLGSVVTDTDQNPIADANRVSFRNPAGGAFYPSIEAPFTWTISTAHSRTGNYLVENTPGENEHWIVNDGIITDPNGRDISASFRAGGEMAKYGPLHFDFKAPTITDNSEVVIAAHGAAAADWVSTSTIYYRDSGGNSARRFRITEMSDMGVGHVYGTTSAIAVGDYSAGRNSDASPNTAFAPLEGLENVTHIHQLPEEDPNVDGVADGGGIDTYVAELQSLADRLGNGTWLGGGRIRTASTFGVDRTPPVISRERPAESVVLSTNELYFEIEDPQLETGEDGSQPRASVHAYAGDSRYWVTSRHYWTANPAPSTAGGSVTVDITPNSTRFAREDTHVVYVRALDVAGNASSTSFTFVRDQTAPVLSLSAVPSNFGLTNVASVSVTVAGTLSDATEIQRAFLSVHYADANGECTAANPLDSRKAANPVRRLHNGTNEIEFSEVFTIKRGDDQGLTAYCIYLSSKDDARDANGGDMANDYNAVIATFNVRWPGTAPAPPVASTAPITVPSLQLGGTTTATVELEPTGADPHFTDPNGDPLTYMAASSDNGVATASATGSTVTVTAVGAGTATITVTASDNGTGTATKRFDVTVADADPVPTFEFMNLDETEIDGELEVAEGAAAGSGVSYAFKLDLPDGATAPTAADPLTVTITAPAGVALNRGGTAQGRSLQLAFPTDFSVATDDTLVVELTTVHDLDIVSNVDAVTHSATGYDDASVMVKSNDDDFEITADVASIEENDAATEVTVTLTAGTATDADRTISVDVTYPTGDAVTGAASTVAVTIDANATSGEATVDVDALDDVAQDEVSDEITLSVSGSDPAAVYTKPASIAIVDNDPDVTLTATINGVATDQVYEDAGTITVVLTATANAPVGQTTVFNLANALTTGSTSLGGTASDADFSPTPPTDIPLTINARETTGTATVTLTLLVTGDGAGVTSETLIFWDHDGSTAGNVSIGKWTMTINEPSSN